jgi:hypothetical protein
MWKVFTLLAYYLAYSLTLKMEALHLSKMLVNFYQTTWRHIQEASHHHENLKSNACFRVHKSPALMFSEPDDSSSHTSIIFSKAQEVSLLSRFCKQNVAFLISCTTCPGHLTFIYLIILTMFVESAIYEAPHYTVFYSLLLLPFRSKYSPQNPVLRHPWSIQWLNFWTLFIVQTQREGLALSVGPNLVGFYQRTET